MRINKSVRERQLAALAKKFRQAAGRSKTEAARELGVSVPCVFNAEEQPGLSLTSLRIRLIEKYSRFRVHGPVYLLKRK